MVKRGTHLDNAPAGKTGGNHALNVASKLQEHRNTVRFAQESFHRNMTLLLVMDGIGKVVEPIIKDTLKYGCQCIIGLINQGMYSNIS